MENSDEAMGHCDDKVEPYNDAMQHYDEAGQHRDITIWNHDDMMQCQIIAL